MAQISLVKQIPALASVLILWLQPGQAEQTEKALPLSRVAMHADYNGGFFDETAWHSPPAANLHDQSRGQQLEILFGQGHDWQLWQGKMQGEFVACIEEPTAELFETLVLLELRRQERTLWRFSARSVITMATATAVGQNVRVILPIGIAGLLADRNQPSRAAPFLCATFALKMPCTPVQTAIAARGTADPSAAVWRPFADSVSGQPDP
ncbi:MAG: hypothetical protein U0176_12915 [Bacteroidia bacterium]